MNQAQASRYSGIEHRITCSVGIMAFNEEQNIGHLLEALLTQSLSTAIIKEIVVVSSACRDRTDDIVRAYEQRDARVRLIAQKEREGKSSAINLWLVGVDPAIDVCVLESGDTLPQPETVERLVAVFQDPRIGMAGAHPVPTNARDTFIGHAVHLLWELHHEIALQTPKLGELVAFRNVLRAIPPMSPVDEANIEVELVRKGYSLNYVPEAIVRNKGPENLRDFLMRRRCIASGHCWLRDKYTYRVATQDPGRIWRLVWRNLRREGLRAKLWTLGAVGLEALGRVLGRYDYYVRKKNTFVWDIAETTKRVVP